MVDKDFFNMFLHLVSVTMWPLPLAFGPAK